jgi:hypothetical protein
MLSWADLPSVLKGSGALQTWSFCGRTSSINPADSFVLLSRGNASVDLHRVRLRSYKFSLNTNHPIQRELRITLQKLAR